MSELLHWIASARQQLQQVKPSQDSPNVAVEPIAAAATSDVRSQSIPRSPLELASLEQLLTVSVGDFLVKEIESTRSRLSQLETERDSTAAALSQSQTLVQQLQAENHQLQIELEQLRQTQSQLAPLLGLLQGLRLQSNSSQSTTSSTSERPPTSASPSTPAPQPQPITPLPSFTPATNSTSTFGETREKSGSLQHTTQPKLTQIDRAQRLPDFTGLNEKPPKKTRSGSDSTTTKINAIVDALIEWNHSCTISTRRLRIGIQPIKGLASKMGADYQPIIQQVLQDRQSELAQLHQHFLLSDRHNRKVHNKDEILQAIAKDFLHLPNWHDVTYP